VTERRGVYRAGKSSEHQQQATVIAWARSRETARPELALLFAVPNAGKRSVIGGRMLKAEGMITGWPDLTLVGPDKRIAFLEVKAEKGRTSAAQDDCLAMLRRMGHDVAVVRSQDDAVLMLQE
jgi:hypothetical protein